MARATAVIVTYHSERLLDRMLAGARRCVDAGALEVVVVDNDSRDGTRARLEGERGWLTFVPSGANIGFGRGCNLGFERVRTPYVLFLNPDAVIEPESVEALVKFMDEHPEAGIVAPAIVEADGRVQSAGKCPTPLSMLRGALMGGSGGAGHEPVEVGSAARRVEWVCGAVFMARTELLRRIGAFDPRFFLYYEETDLCRRVATAGAEIWSTGGASAHHEAGASADEVGGGRVSGCIAEHYYRSRYYYLVKHHGSITARLVEALEVVLLAVESGARRALRRGHGRLRERLAAPKFELPAPVEERGRGAGALAGGAPTPEPEGAMSR